MAIIFIQIFSFKMNSTTETIVLVTSVIHISNKPLSYSPTRSIYSSEVRFQQTKRTILSVRNNIQNCVIVLIECSNLLPHERSFIIANVDVFINLYENGSNSKYVDNINSISKSLGEGTLTAYGLRHIFRSKIRFQNFIKISGRYWINTKFNGTLFNLTGNIIVSPINGDKRNICTSLYKLNYPTSLLWTKHLMMSEAEFKRAIGFELIFADFIGSISDDFEILFVDSIGVTGLIAVDGLYHEW